MDGVQGVWLLSGGPLRIEEELIAVRNVHGGKAELGDANTHTNSAR
jgi:hypothetical protein